MTGRRIEHPDSTSLEGVEPGDYWKDANGHWWVCGPVPRDEDGALCLVADVTTWSVTEHEDRTITVSPSIFWDAGGYHAPPEWAAAHTWHGFLERGIWRSV